MNSQLSERIETMSQCELVSLVKEIYKSVEFYSSADSIKFPSIYAKGFKDGKVVTSQCIISYVESLILS